MKAHLVPRSRSFAKLKVKYQGHSYQRMAVFRGSSFSQTQHLIYNIESVADCISLHIFIKTRWKTWIWCQTVQYFLREVCRGNIIAEERIALSTGWFPSPCLTLSQTSSGFYVSAVQVFLKTMWEKEKLLVMNNFSFSHSVFYPFGELCAIFIKCKIVVCKLFNLEVSKICHFGEVNTLPHRANFWQS